MTCHKYFAHSMIERLNLGWMRQGLLAVQLVERTNSECFCNVRGRDSSLVSSLFETPADDINSQAPSSHAPHADRFEELERIFVNVAKLLEFLRRVAAFPNYLFSIDLDQS